jgi:hypothetical protein
MYNFYNLGLRSGVAEDLNTPWRSVISTQRTPLFWDMTPCHGALGFRPFEGTSCLHFQGSGGPHILCYVSRAWDPGSSLTAVAKQRGRRSEDMDSVAVGGRGFSFQWRVQTASGAHPVSNAMNNESFFSPVVD